MKKFMYGIMTIFIILFAAPPAYGQVDIGVDIMSRYVWRGFEFGNSPSIQPEMSISSGGFSAGVWGAFATSGDPEGTEVDLWAAYTFATESGDFTLSVTDYTFPIHHTGLNGAETWFEGDAHFVEVGLGYDGPESFPISVFAGMFVHNDDDNSVYIELGYDAGPVNFFLGFTPSESAAYATTGAGIINAGFGATREVRISETFSIDLNAAVVANPYAEHLFFVFGIGF
jgi:hypothetical protein